MPPYITYATRPCREGVWRWRREGVVGCSWSVMSSLSSPWDSCSGVLQITRSQAEWGLNNIMEFWYWVHTSLTDFILKDIVVVACKIGQFSYNNNENWFAYHRDSILLSKRDMRRHMGSNWGYTHNNACRGSLFLVGVFNFWTSREWPNKHYAPINERVT